MCSENTTSAGAGGVLWELKKEGVVTHKAMAFPQTYASTIIFGNV